MSSAIKSTLWATLGNWGQQIFAFVTMIVVARLLDPAAFGVLAIAMLFILLLQRVLLESIGFAVVRTESITPSYLNAAFVFSVGGGLLFGLILFLTAPFFAQLFSEPQLKPVLQVLALMPVIDGLGMVQTGLLRRDMQFKALAMRTLGANFLSGIVGISCALYGLGVWSLVAQQLVMSMGGLVVLWYACNWRPTHVWRKQDFSNIAYFGLPMVGNAILFVFANRLDIVFLAAAANSSVTGIYSFAKRVVRMVTDLFVSGAMNVSLSMLSALKGDKAQQKNLVVMQLKFVSLIVFPLFIGLSCVASDLVPLMLGAKWIDAIPVLQVLAVFGVVQVVILMCTNVLVSAGSSKELFIFNMCGVAVLTLLLVFAVNYGAGGVAAAFVTQSLITLPLLLCLVKLRTGIAAGSMLKALLPATISVLVMAVFLQGLLITEFIQTLVSFIRLPILILTGSVVYTLSIFCLMGKDTKMMLNGMLSKIRINTRSK
ncbi:MAG: lipopolysaccharide biosynthesis protein [Pseudomonadota bacterium]